MCIHRYRHSAKMYKLQDLGKNPIYIYIYIFLRRQKDRGRGKWKSAGVKAGETCLVVRISYITSTLWLKETYCCFPANRHTQPRAHTRMNTLTRTCTHTLTHASTSWERNALLQVTFSGCTADVCLGLSMCLKPDAWCVSSLQMLCVYVKNHHLVFHILKWTQRACLALGVVFCVYFGCVLVF